MSRRAFFNSRGAQTGAPRNLTNIEIIDRLLRPKIAGEALADDVAHLNVHYADLYSSTPDELAARHLPGPRRNWEYFLSHARYRNGSKLKRKPCHGGLWKACTPRKMVGDDGLVSYLRYHSYKMHGARTDWTMIEYSVPEDQQDDGDKLVLCKMHKYRSWLL